MCNLYLGGESSPEQIQRFILVIIMCHYIDPLVTQVAGDLQEKIITEENVWDVIMDTCIQIIIIMIVALVPVKTFSWALLK